MGRKIYLPDDVRKEFGFYLPVHIRFSDIDGYMHVNNGIYFNYMEHARAMYLHQICQWDFHKTGAVVANINIDFIKPLHFFDQPQSYVRCSNLGTTSFELKQVLMGKNNFGVEEVYSKAAIIMVTVDLNTHKTSPVPVEYASKIRRYEGLEI
jgi:acyl-CoA thioester hydrolase